MTDEYLSAMQELWTKREPSFSASTRSSASSPSSQALQKPHPPIWSAPRRASLRRPCSSAPRGIRSTARRGAADRSGRDRAALQLEARDAPALTLRNDIRILRPGQSARHPPRRARARRRANALVDQIRELAGLGVEHLVLEFLAADAASSTSSSPSSPARTARLA